MHHGSNPSATDNNNNTPLHLATLNGHDSVSFYCKINKKT